MVKRTWSTCQVLHVLESSLIACIAPESREIDFAIALRLILGGAGADNAEDVIQYDRRQHPGLCQPPQILQRAFDSGSWSH